MEAIQRHLVLDQFVDGYVQLFPMGSPGDRPLPGRSAPGGSVPFIVYRPSTRIWYRVFQNPNGTYEYLYYTPYRSAGDIPTNGAIASPSSVGNYITLYRPSTSTFYLAQTNGLTSATRQLGQQGDVPLVLDIDGDLLYDAATYRLSNGQWSIQLSGSSNANVTYFWGNPETFPFRPTMMAISETTSPFGVPLRAPGTSLVRRMDGEYNTLASPVIFRFQVRTYTDCRDLKTGG